MGKPRAALRPTVHILTTGGTIAATPSGMLTAADLLATIPDLASIAAVTVESFVAIGSSLMTPAHWGALALCINALWRERPDLSGIVITHGTDTLEETAYFLHLTNQDPRPLVITGAMRSANALSADGPANLRAALVVAAAPNARERGTLVAMNNEIHPARDAVKAHTLRVDAFVSGAGGMLGTIYGSTINWLRQAARSTAQPPFVITPDQPLPRVEIIYSYAGADGQLIENAMADGAQGIVIAAFGSGRLPQGQIDAIQRVLVQGVIVVISSRVGNGPVEVNYPHNLAASTTDHGVILAGDLNPQKARVLLLLALTQTTDPQAIQAIFAAY
jgi:L-asparaginase type II